MADNATKLDDDDVSKILATQAYLGSTKCNFQMKQYIYSRRPDGNYVLHISKLWSKMLLAARAIAAIENPADVCVIGGRPYAQRGLLKYAAHTGATPIAGRFTPGTFTNQIQRAFKEPRLLVVVDPYQDHQAITEASYVNIPVIAFCNSDSPLKLVDIAIPCNNKGKQSIGLMLWMLAREVLVLRGRVSRAERACGFTLDGKMIMPDLYFYRDQEDEEVKNEVPTVVPDDQAEEQWGGDAAHADDNVGMPGVANLMSAHPIDDWAAEAQQWTTPAAGGDSWGGQQAGNW